MVQEGGYDFLPFDPSNSDQYGVLFNSRRYVATFPIASGAACFTKEEQSWWLEWVWIHPHERGRGLLGRAWAELEDLYGAFKIRGPYSAPMIRFLLEEAIGQNRLDHPLDDRAV